MVLAMTSLRPAVGDLALERPLEEPDEAVPRGRHLAAACSAIVDHLVDARLEQRLHQLATLGEAAVDRADTDAGAPGDLVVAGVEAVLGEDLGGGLEDQLAVAGGVARAAAARPRRADRPWSCGRWYRTGEDFPFSATDHTAQVEKALRLSVYSQTEQTFRFDSTSEIP